MRYISLFSGIEATSVAWLPLGWEAVAFSEYDPATKRQFAADVLAYHYPSVPNLGDISTIDWSDYAGKIDVVIGGSPCQSFSVAGLRQGLADPRGSLMLEYLRALAAIRPTWAIWENVPGILSADRGRAFATLLKGLEECGYGTAYRICDAQFYGVAQRRRRVFVVGHFGGDWRRSAAVLFECESLFWDFASSKDKREALTQGARRGASIAIAGNIIGRADGNGGNGLGTCEDVAYTLTATDRHGVLPFDTAQITSRENRSNPQWGDPCHTLNASGHPPTVIASEDAGSPNYQEIVGSLCARDYKGVGSQYVSEGKLVVTAPAFSRRPAQQLPTNVDGLSYALTTGQPPNICKEQTVRRLTPLECERLQGFPDHYTDIYDKTPDAPRYRALGNSMAVPVVAWLGKQIMAVEATR